MDSLGRLIIIFLVVFFLVIKPLQYGSEIQNTNNVERAEQMTRQFIHEICYHQELSVATYEAYLQKLERTGNVYQIKLSIGHTMKEIAVREKNQQTILHFEPRNTSILEENPYVLSLFSIEDHVHEEDCYFGTKHEHIGTPTTGGACYGAPTNHSHSSSCYGERVCGQYRSSHITYYYDVKYGTCSGCGYENNNVLSNTSTPSASWNCPDCGKSITSTNVTATRTYYISKCDNCSSTIQDPYGVGYLSGEHKETDYNNLICTKPTGISYALICTIKEGVYFNGVEETDDPKCNRVVVSMKPLYETQRIELGDAINMQCIATFLDGHEQIINCTSNYNSGLREQEVTLTYEGLLYTAKNTGKLTAKTKVTTITYYTCPDCGARYESDGTGADKGCPFETNTLLGIRVTPKKTVYELGEELQLEVIGIFKKEEVVIRNWISNYNAYAKGKQTVLVQYQSFTKEIEVTLRTNAEVVCPDCGTIYDTEEYALCPNESNQILYIEAYLETNEIEFGEDLPVYLIVTYQDGYQEYYEDGFEIIGYDKFTPGVQDIIIKYEGFEDHIQIVNIAPNTTLLTCENGHTYLSNKDGSDPGCPTCSVGSGESDDYNYVDITYHEEVIEKLYQDTVLKLESGDFLSIEVTFPKSSFEKLKDTIFLRGTTGSETRFVYGGEVN